MRTCTVTDVLSYSDSGSATITQLGDLQKAYDDIVVQLRTAYSITFRSNVSEVRDNRASPRLKVRVKRDSSFVKLGSIVEVSQN